MNIYNGEVHDFDYDAINHNSPPSYFLAPYSLMSGLSRALSIAVYPSIRIMAYLFLRSTLGLHRLRTRRRVYAMIGLFCTV